MADAAGRLIPEISERRFRFFLLYIRRYLRRHFHAVRVAGVPPAPPGPVVVYANHPAWWDPLVCLFLADRFFPDRRHYGPMDAAALARYGVFSKLGFFGVEAGTRAGARTFLRTATAILGQPGAMLWMTPQGRFADPRERPVTLEPGLSVLARRLGRCTFLPLAFEYPFWRERTPEALARFGRPMTVTADDAGAGEPPLAAALEETQDALARAAVERRAEDFETLLSGKVGVGGVYDLWRRLKARARGERFEAAHTLASEQASGSEPVSGSERNG